MSHLGYLYPTQHRSPDRAHLYRTPVHTITTLGTNCRYLARWQGALWGNVDKYVPRRAIYVDVGELDGVGSWGVPDKIALSAIGEVVTVVWRRFRHQYSDMCLPGGVVLTSYQHLPFDVVRCDSYWRNVWGSLSSMIVLGHIPVLYAVVFKK